MKIQCSKSQLKKLGDKLRHKELLTAGEEALLAEFRLGHRSIIEAFRNHHNVVCTRTKWRDKGILFASRLKKRQTLVNKLSDRLTHMDLTRMHDIAGCRIIFLNLSDMVRYRTHFNNRLKDNHHFVLQESSDRYDYVRKPRSTGYRGIHDVYEETVDDSVKAKIEVQYRTLTQHSWATALEIWDHSHRRGAKFGTENEEVQRLFCLYAELLWRECDWTPEWPRDSIGMTDEELYRAIRDGERKLGVLKFLSELEVVSSKVRVSGEEILLHRLLPGVGIGDNGLVARQLEWDSVRSELFSLELDDANDIVFVQTKPKILRKTYNNYFDDAGGFVSRVRRAMTKLYNRRSFLRFRHKMDSIFVAPKRSGRGATDGSHYTSSCTS